MNALLLKVILPISEVVMVNKKIHIIDNVAKLCKIFENVHMMLPTLWTKTIIFVRFVPNFTLKTTMIKIEHYLCGHDMESVTLVI